MKQKLKSLIPGNTTLQIVKKAVRTGDTIQITDLDNWLFISGDKITDAPATVFDVKTLNSTGSLELSAMNEEIDPEELPEFERTDMTPVISLSADLVNSLPSFLPYVSTDYTTRKSLTGICYKPGVAELCGTDGHMLRMQSAVGQSAVPQSAENEYIFSTKSAIFIKGMQKKATLIKSEIVKEIDRDCWLHLIYVLDGLEYNYYCNMIEGPYPEFKKVIPETEVREEFSCFDVEEYLKTLKQIKKFPFSEDNKRCKSLYIGEKGIMKRTMAGAKLFDAENIIESNTSFCSVNMEIMIKDLADLKRGAKVYKMGSKLGAMKIESGTTTFILMPLRHQDDETVLEYIKKQIG